MILVDGALCYRDAHGSGKLAERLAGRFTVYRYDRRGRGESTDTTPYSPEREIDDIAALVAQAGGSVSLYGSSSGAALALDAASGLAGIRSVAIYELPFVTDSTRDPLPADYAEQIDALVAAGRNAQTLSYFMTTGLGLPAIMKLMARVMPGMGKLRAIAPTVAYDTAILGAGYGAGKPLPTTRWADINAPVMVAAGSKSSEWIRNTQQRLAELLGAEHHTLQRQTHTVKPEALAPVLAKFFAAHDERR